jgi:hypothetical protein
MKLVSVKEVTIEPQLIFESKISSSSKVTKVKTTSYFILGHGALFLGML